MFLEMYSENWTVSPGSPDTAISSLSFSWNILSWSENMQSMEITYTIVIVLILVSESKIDTDWMRQHEGTKVSSFDSNPSPYMFGKSSIKTINILPPAWSTPVENSTAILPPAWSTPVENSTIEQSHHLHGQPCRKHYYIVYRAILPPAWSTPVENSRVILPPALLVSAKNSTVIFPVPPVWLSPAEKKRTEFVPHAWSILQKTAIL